jgi:hypothetical protein
VTDFETIKAMLIRAGIAFEERLRLEEGTPRRVLQVEDGYAGFYSDLEFTIEDGKLIRISAWE